MLSHCNMVTVLTVFAHNWMESFVSFSKPCFQLRTSLILVLLPTITSWLVSLPLISPDLNPSFCLINLPLVLFYSFYYHSQKASITLNFYIYIYIYKFFRPIICSILGVPIHTKICQSGESCEPSHNKIVIVFTFTPKFYKMSS